MVAALVAGPLISFEPENGIISGLDDAAQLGMTGGLREGKRGGYVLRLPTVQLHRTQDLGLKIYRQLLK